MVQPKEEGKRLEEEYLDHEEESLVTITNKSSMVEELIIAEEDLAKEVEVEDEAKRLSFGVTNEISWGISRLNVQEKKT